MRFRMLVAGASILALATALPATPRPVEPGPSGTGVWYGDSVHSAGSALSPAVRVEWGSATIAAFANVSRVGGGFSTQGSLAPSLFTPSVGPFSGEFAASLGGSTHPDGTRTGQALGVARAYLSRADAGVWVGGGLGATWDGVTWRDVRQGEAGVWATLVVSRRWRP